MNNDKINVESDEIMNNDKIMDNDKIKELATQMAVAILQLKPELKDLGLRDKFDFYPMYYESSIQFIESILKQKISINNNDKPKTK